MCRPFSLVESGISDILTIPFCSVVNGENRDPDYRRGGRVGSPWVSDEEAMEERAWASMMEDSSASRLRWPRARAWERSAKTLTP